MSSYPPPSQTVPTYNPDNFPSTPLVDTLTPAEADALFFKKSERLFGIGDSNLPTYSFEGAGNSSGMAYNSNLLRFRADGATSLSLSSTQVQNNVAAQFISGTNSTPSLTFSGDNTTGFYRIGSGNVGITCAGTKQVDISSTAAAFTPNGIQVMRFQNTTVHPTILLSKTTGSNNDKDCPIFRNGMISTYSQTFSGTGDGSSKTILVSFDVSSTNVSSHRCSQVVSSITCGQNNGANSGYLMRSNLIRKSLASSSAWAVDGTTIASAGTAITSAVDTAAQVSTIIFEITLPAFVAGQPYYACITYEFSGSIWPTSVSTSGP